MNRSAIAEFLSTESGATSIEYALIAAIVSMCIILGLTQISGSLQSTFNSVGSTIAASGK
jgi:pilus assembly protein Flp/PilA